MRDAAIQRRPVMNNENNEIRKPPKKKKQTRSKNFCKNFNISISENLVMQFKSRSNSVICDRPSQYFYLQKIRKKLSAMIE